MKFELEYIGRTIILSSEKLSSEISMLQLKDYKNTGLSSAETDRWGASLIELLGRALLEDQEIIVEEVRVWAHQTGEVAIKNGVPVDEFLQSIASFRTGIWELFSEELEKKQFAAITMLDVSKIINPLIDEISYIFTHIYVEENKRMMEIAYSTLEELSVPVVPISQEIAVLPLIGEIDTKRSQLIMDTALKQSTTFQFSYLLIDVSGVPIMDTSVAHYIYQIVSALKLIGVDVIVTGIRPEIAQTLVSLGINFRDIQTRANLKQALEQIGFTNEKINSTCS